RSPQIALPDRSLPSTVDLPQPNAIQTASAVSMTEVTWRSTKRLGGFAARVLVLALALGAAGGSAAGQRAGTITVVYRTFSDVQATASYMPDTNSQFEIQNPGVTVQLVPATASQEEDYATNVRLMQRSRATAPDVLVEDSCNIAADAAAAYLLPLDDSLADW